jgi:hypothetical protein
MFIFLMVFSDKSRKNFDSFDNLILMVARLLKKFLVEIYFLLTVLNTITQQSLILLLKITERKAQDIPTTSKITQLIRHIVISVFRGEGPLLY